MAKRKKLQDQNPPRRVEIRGQDHLLAYITPEEAQMLMDNGGAGKPGPMGIPAFYDPGGTADPGQAAEGGFSDDFSSGYSGVDTGVSGGDGNGDSGGFTEAELAAGAAARAAIDAHNAAVAAGQRPGEGSTNYTQEFGSDVADAMAQNEKNRLAQQVAQSYIDYAGIMGPELYSAGNVGGSLLDFFKTGSTGSVPIRSNYFADPTTLSAFKDIALGQIPGKMERAKERYGIPGFMGGVLGAIGGFSTKQIKDGLEAGGRPVFDSAGNLKGVFNEGPFGEVYTGMAVEGVEGTGYDAGGSDGGPELEVKPVNPVTGQCDEGYMFDEDLQACRLDTGSGAGADVAGTTFAPGAYARMGLLDVAPTGLPGFSEQYGIPSQDFDEANLAFRRGTATQAGIFQDPYDLTGYSLLG